MMNGFCDAGTWGSLGDFGGWSWIGLILDLVFWVGLVAGLALLVVWVVRRGRTLAAVIPVNDGEPDAREILQARLARGEIDRQRYDQVEQDLER